MQIALTKSFSFKFLRCWIRNLEAELPQKPPQSPLSRKVKVTGSPANSQALSHLSGCLSGVADTWILLVLNTNAWHAILTSQGHVPGRSI